MVTRRAVANGRWLLTQGPQAARTRTENAPADVSSPAHNALAKVPVNIFGMVLGLGGLTNAWHALEQWWGLAPLVSAWLMALVSLLWVGCLLTMCGKWLLAREAALLEVRDPGKFALYALVPMSTLVLSLVLRSRAPTLAFGLLVTGLFVQTLVAVLNTANLWRGNRQLDAIDSAVLMPAVGGCFVAAAASGGHGHKDWAVLFFGAGLGSWLITESLVLQRLALYPLPKPKRATIGIHLTPAAIASVAYLSLTEGVPDLFAQMLFGYGLLQALVTLRIVPFLREQSFALGTWAYTFGLSALCLAAIRFVLRGQAGAISILALPLFCVANAIIGWIAVVTLLRGVFGLVDASSTRNP